MNNDSYSPKFKTSLRWKFSSKTRLPCKITFKKCVLGQLNKMQIKCFLGTILLSPTSLTCFLFQIQGSLLQLYPQSTCSRLARNHRRQLLRFKRQRDNFGQFHQAVESQGSFLLFVTSFSMQHVPLKGWCQFFQINLCLIEKSKPTISYPKDWDQNLSWSLLKTLIARNFLPELW